MSEGYGSKLLPQPELIADMVKQTRGMVSKQAFSVSIKIRINSDLRRTVDLCRMAQAAGLSFITVHARTPAQRHEPVNAEAFALVKTALDIPVFANGDVRSLQDATRIVQESGVDGMCLR